MYINTSNDKSEKRGNTSIVRVSQHSIRFLKLAEINYDDICCYIVGNINRQEFPTIDHVAN